MNIQMIPAHSVSVVIVAEEICRRTGWSYNLYDSDMPEGPANKADDSTEEMANMFGAAVHTVTFFDADGRKEHVIAGLMLLYPEVAYTELVKKLRVGSAPPSSLEANPPVTVSIDPQAGTLTPFGSSVVTLAVGGGK